MQSPHLAAKSCPLAAHEKALTPCRLADSQCITKGCSCRASGVNAVQDALLHCHIMASATEQNASERHWEASAVHAMHKQASESECAAG